MSKAIRTQKVYKIDFFGREEPDGIPEERDPWLHTAYAYDVRGNLLSEVSYTTYGLTEQTATYTYDAADRLTSEKFVQEGDDFSEWREYLRDEQGMITQEVHHFLDGTQDVVEYQYGDDGKLLRKAFVNDDGDLEKEEIMTYANGKLLEEKTLSYDGALLAKHLYEYHSNGEIQQHEQLIPDEKGELKHMSFYDESGNKIKVLVYNGLGQLVEITRMTYDENNVLIKTEEENQFKNGVIAYETDEENRVKRQIEKDPDGALISSVIRTYDADGRILESVVFVEGSVLQSTQDYKLQYEYEFYE